MKNRVLKSLSRFGLAAVCLLLLSFTAQERPVHIFLAGDSTMANKPLYKWVKDPATGLESPEAFPERGWGMVLPEYFTDEVVIENYAKNGQSSKSFIQNGNWAKVEAGMQKGDYLIIQFGHNDSSPSKGERHSPPEQYKDNLRRLVDGAKAKGANPIICSSIARRKFDENNKIENTHDGYTQLAEEVAKEKKIPFVDLYATTEEMLNKAGTKKSTEYFVHIPAGVNRTVPKGLQDDTHLVEKGAKAVASQFIAEAEKQNIKGLTKYLKKNEAPYVSKVWVADLGNGKYKNPILNADYSDPDACRVGDDYYMTASSFNCIPGLPILHSKDLVNWTIIGHAIPRLTPDDHFSAMQQGNGVWAPAIRYHKGEFYIYYGDPDFGIYMTKTTDPAGEWEPLTLVKPGKGLIDACPFWDNDGQAYLAHAYAGSRAGIKSILMISRMTPDGKQAIGDSKVIYDGHELDPTIEGPKVYKRNGYYYIFAPGGGVATGWQTVLRSKNIWGPYERRNVMEQGSTTVNGPHQGAWVDTKTGEDWFIHFQDIFTFGRVTHLQPMKWVNDWPVIGEDKDGDGRGEPVMTYKKPNVGATYPIATPAESDEFNSNELGLQWQWYANPQDWWHFTNQEKGVLSLYTQPVPQDYKSLWDMPNLLLQKTPSTDFTATAKVTFHPNKQIKGERAGLTMLGMDYGLIGIESTEEGLMIYQGECKKADRGGKEETKASAKLNDNTVYLRVKVSADSNCIFSYSADGKKFTKLGDAVKVREGKWIGVKVGFFTTRPVSNNDGGKLDVDWFRIEK